MTRAVNDPTGRNVALLAVCQALGMSSSALVISVSALVGSALAPDTSLATLPLALQMAGVMATTAPASLLMRRIGRRAGFSLGAVLGMMAGDLGTWAIVIASFPLFCLASVLFGSFNAPCPVLPLRRGGYGAPGLQRPRDLSGSGRWPAGRVPRARARQVVARADRLGALRRRLPVHHGARAAVARDPAVRPGAPSRSQATRRRGRPLLVIAARPIFVVAVLSGMVGYGTMNLAMSRDATGRGGRRASLRDRGLRDPVAHRRHVWPFLLHRSADPPLRSAADPGGRRDIHARRRRDQPRGPGGGQLLGGLVLLGVG